MHKWTIAAHSRLCVLCSHFYYDSVAREEKKSLNGRGMPPQIIHDLWKWLFICWTKENSKMCRKEKWIGRSALHWLDELMEPAIKTHFAIENQAMNIDNVLTSLCGRDSWKTGAANSPDGTEMVKPSTVQQLYSNWTNRQMVVGRKSSRNTIRY